MIITELLKNRPFAFFCAVFMIASVGGFFAIGTVKLIAIAVALIVATVCALICLVKKRVFSFLLPTLLVCIALIFASVLSFVCFDVNYLSMRKYDGAIHKAEGTVTDVIYENDHFSSYKVRLNSVDGEPCAKTVYLEFEHTTDLRLGTEFVGDFEFSEPADTEIGYYRKTNMISEGITAVLAGADELGYEIIGKSESPEIYFGELNAELSTKLSRAVGGEAGDLASAMFLADRSGLGDKTELDFSRSGISHLLALSGLHMGIVAAILEFLLRKISVRKTVRCIVISASLVLYLALVGFAVSAMRSVIMILVVYLAYVMRAPSDMTTSLFFAGFLILAIFPSAVCDIGFWMSFFATLGIITLSPYLSKLFAPKRKQGDLKVFLLRALRWLVSAIAVTLVANFSVLFFTWLAFGQVSLVSPLTNLLLAPVASFVIFFGALTLVFFGIPQISAVCAAVCGFFGELILKTSAYFSDIRGIVLSLKYDFAGYIICAFSVITLILLFIKLKRKYLVLAPAAAMVIGFAVCLFAVNALNFGKTETAYVREMNGEEIIISQNGRTVICDVSDGYYSRLALGKALAEEMCATETEVLIFTHYHSRQAVAAEKFFNNCKTRALWIPEPESVEEYEILKDISEKAKLAGVPVSIYKRGSEMRLGGATLTVLGYRKLDRSSELLVGVSVENGESRFTYLSSAYGEAEIPFEIRDIILDSEHIVFGAHGPKPKLRSYFEIGEGCENIVIANKEASDAGLLRFFGKGKPKTIVAPEYFEVTLE